MASYDCYDANHNEFAGYELEAGEYTLSVSKSAHDAEAIITCNISENIQYDTETATGLTVSNKFTGEDAVDGVSVDGSDSEQNITYLTRADFEGTFPKENTDSRAMSDNIAEINLYTKEMAESWIDENDEAINTGAKNGLIVEENGVITDLGYELGADYKNLKWEEVLDELTVDEMENLVKHAYSHVGEVSSIGKSLTLDADGPSQIGGFTMLNAGTGFPAASVMAQTWNVELAKEEGRVIGLQASERGYSGWYAPAMNIHRSPLNGRNYEYYSEDALLSGIMCGNTVSGAKDSGIYCFIKHFICNDGESDIYRDGVYIWMTEQDLREIYLEPFRIAIEDYDATGLMSSYNRIGAVWTGGSTALLTGVLRDEWDFKGAVITDYSDHHAFMNGDQMLRAGGDLWMDGVGGEFFCETESNSYMQALRKASKHIIYMYLNARVQNAEYAKVSGDDSFIAPVTTQRFPLWKKVVIGIDIIAGCLFALALWRLIKAVKLKKSLKQQIVKNNPV